MKKLLFPLLCFLLLAFVSSTGARMNIVVVGGSVPAVGDSCSCQTPTYDACYTGDHATATDYICYESDATSEDATNNTADVVSTSYIEYDAADENVQWTITGDLSAGLDSEGTIFVDFYVIDRDADTNIHDASVFELRYNAANCINCYVRGAFDRIDCRFEGNTSDQIAAAGSLSFNTWYRLGYTWQTGADAAGKHSVSVVAKTAATSWQEDVVDLDDWDDGGAVDPLTFTLGEAASSKSDERVRIRDSVILTGYQTTDPDP
jgi:hypothetical protein